MRGTLCIGAFRNAATVITTALFLGGCLIQDKNEDDDVVASDVADAALEDEFELSGSVGDGPVVGAAMRVISNDGSILNEFESDASAAGSWWNTEPRGERFLTPPSTRTSVSSPFASRASTKGKAMGIEAEAITPSAIRAC